MGPLRIGSSAARYTNGLKADPGWRRARMARSSGLEAKSRPPTSARTPPVSGSIAISAACNGSFRRPVSYTHLTLPTKA